MGHLPGFPRRRLWIDPFFLTGQPRVTLSPAKFLKPEKHLTLRSLWPGGGVPVAVRVAKALHVPLFPMIARKIGAPWEKELALGALSENGGLYWNRELIESMDISPEAMERLVDKAWKEIREKVSRLRWGKSLPALSGKRIVLVDDGAATGATNFAAITDILAENPEHLVVAVPVAPPEFEKKVRRMGAEPLVLHAPADFRAVGEWYERFPEVTDGEVLLVLGSLSRPGKAEG